MHAGDGNVHTNIPVNSDDYDMLQAAHGAVVRIMALARSLDGVISGEHGIGITKLAFLTDAELAPFAQYKQQVDPNVHFNKGKLLRSSVMPAGTTLSADIHAADLTHAYTPSFGLMWHESLIMQQSDIGAISSSVKDCLRCGKCKPVCATMFRAPTCCTARVTRFWQPLFWLRHSCTKSRPDAGSQLPTGKNLKTLQTTARCAINA